MISPIIERPSLNGVPYIALTGQLDAEAAERVRRGGRPVWHVPQGRLLTRSERELVARVRSAELERLRHPERWAARRRRAYEIDLLRERYADVIRGAPVVPIFHGLGALVATPSPLAPLAILQADGVTVEWFCHGDLDVAVSSGAATAWGDQSVNNFDCDTPGSSGSEPAYVELSSGIGYRNFLSFDGSNDYMDATGLDTPSPSTRATWLWAVFYQDVWSGPIQVIGDITANAALRVLQEGTSPELRIRASSSTGVNGNTGLAVDTWGEIVAYSSDSTNDYLKAGSTTVSGANASAGTETAGTAKRLGAATGASPSVFANVDFAAVLQAQSNPSANARAALRQWITQYYGSGVLV